MLPLVLALPSAVGVVIQEEMTLHAYERSSDGVEGSEIVAGGFPLTPARFCGRPGVAAPDWEQSRREVE